MTPAQFIARWKDNPLSELRSKLVGLSRYIATVETSKHRIFVWLPISISPEHRLIVIPT
ncbi:MAG: hypothetical protein Q8N07_07685 [Rhodocyclaceae bacterium]|nr:hypothetical protein [Rhodocyclaceae bacterium]